MNERIFHLAAIVRCRWEVLNSYEKWKTDLVMVWLQNELRDRGFPFLAKAVNGGIAWARKIGDVDLGIGTLEQIEEYASQPGWSWNQNEI